MKTFTYILLLSLSMAVIVSCGEKDQPGQYTKPTVIANYHTGCANDAKTASIRTKSEAFPVGTLTATLTGGELLLNHENCTANCSIGDGDVFVPKITVTDDVIELSNKLKESSMRCMCPVESVILRIGGIDERTYTLKYNFCGTAFSAITLHLQEGQSETIDLASYEIL